ncbi:hypothetical protein CONPUDRAFT_166755 [Coniophora puteana RWD-64-598 SS2]|uniref:F-box domain-containing protein n=1 Tax=Coniophora puteana (strain RWD-64-598) TaxID=741705 RepID=A0A5M3MIK2_CONPW|nr:uncharacterized protein CONPUDRAFT_166755 [Coniophora puteana RWD-64-598 SS2]EIW78877.1 hypothetical protein CONPUDRAFT_166755 [Coniophora puteana RWD-64-598 SS2]
MHLVFQITELLKEIVTYLDRVSLARLIQVCKTFEEPALDALYTKIDCFYALLTCMPEDLWSIESPSVAWYPGPPTLRFERPMVQTDWDALLKHSHRVHVLHQGFDGQHERFDANSDVLRALEHCPVPYIFPNLHTLLWNFGEVGAPIRFVLTPKLRRVRLALTPDGLAETAPELGSLCPSLESLELDGSPDELPASPEFVSIIQRLTHLRTLDCGENCALTTPLLNHVASLPNFHRLRLFAWPDSDWMQQRRRIGLQSLDTLHLEQFTWDVASAAVDLLFGNGTGHGSARLSGIKAALMFDTWFNRGIQSDFARFIGTLSRSVSCSDFHELEIKAVGLSEHTWKNLLPLAAFPNMTSITIDHGRSDGSRENPSTVFPNFAALSQLIQAWPHLEHLNISFCVPPLPLRDFVAILHLCPLLEYANVDIDVFEDPEDVATFLSEGSFSVRNERITTLHLRPPAATDVRQTQRLQNAFARYIAAPALYRILPSLTKITDYCSGGGYTPSRFWDPIEAELEAMRIRDRNCIRG